MCIHQSEKNKASFELQHKITALEADLNVCTASFEISGLPDNVRADLDTFAKYSADLRNQLETRVASHQATLNELDDLRKLSSLKETEHQELVIRLNREMSNAQTAAEKNDLTLRMQAEALKSQLDAAEIAAANLVRANEEEVAQLKDEIARGAAVAAEERVRLEEQLAALRAELDAEKRALRNATLSIQASKPAPAHGRAA